MELATATQPKRNASARQRSIERRGAPLLAMAGGLLVLAVGAGLVAAHVTAFALDETLLEQSAVHYTSGLPHTLFHDLDARATNRLYPLVLSIALRAFAGAQALRLDHVLSVLLFLSAAVPIFMFARVVLRSSWLAVAAALLSVAVPWLTLTSALFTENLSYPLFWWAMLATAAALWRPAAGRDALALAAIALLVATRVQFAAVFAGYLLALLLRSLQLAGSRGSAAARARSALATAARGYPLALLTLLAAVAVVVYENASGKWQHNVEALLGSYSNVVIRNGLPGNMGEGVLVELIALALGVGLLPAIVSLAWFLRRVARPSLERRWVYVAGSGVVMAVFVVLTVYSQGGYLGSMTEERYFFYVIPAFWLGAFAALEDRDVRAVELVLVGVALALVYASIPFLASLSQESAFLDPVESIVPHVLSRRFADVGLTGLSMQDALAALALIAAAFVAWLWRAGRVPRLGWIVGLAAGAQLLLTGYAFAVVDGRIDSIPGRTGGSVAALGWVDAHVGGGEAAWLENLPSGAPLALPDSPVGDQQRATLFWNSSLRSWLRVPELGLPPVEVPMAALAGAEVAVGATGGALVPAAAVASLRYAVGATDSPFLQLQGQSLARSPDGVLTLTRLQGPARAAWVARGLSAQGALPAGGRVRIAAFADGRASGPVALSAVLAFLPPPPPAVAGVRVQPRTLISARLGGAVARAWIAAGGTPVRLSLSTCAAPGSAATGAIATSSRLPAGAPAATLERVELRSGACRSGAQPLPPAR